MVSMKGTGVGSLGGFLNGCIMPPAAPCGGGTVEIGMLGAVLKGEGGSNVMRGNSSSGGGTVGPTSPSTSPLAFTGGAGSFVRGGSGCGAAAAGMGVSALAVGMVAMLV